MFTGALVCQSVHVEVTKVVADGVNEKGVKVAAKVFVHLAFQLGLGVCRGSAGARRPVATSWMVSVPTRWDPDRSYECSDGCLDAGNEDHYALIEAAPCEVFDTGAIRSAVLASMNGVVKWACSSDLVGYP